MAFRVILLNYLREPAGLRSLAVQMNSHRAYRVFSTTSDHFLADDMVTAMEKITENKNKAAKERETPKSFASLLRNSAFIGVGDVTINHTRVKGKIVQVQDDNVYVDIGTKFHCVCKRPEANAERYRRGEYVIVLLKDFELSARFLGSLTDTTLLEADGVIMGVMSKRTRKGPGIGEPAS